jgi:hypothetical protein
LKDTHNSTAQDNAGYSSTSAAILAKKHNDMTARHLQSPIHTTPLVAKAHMSTARTFQALLITQNWRANYTNSLQ